jgi:hypothetical protein
MTQHKWIFLEGLMLFLARGSYPWILLSSFGSKG